MSGLELERITEDSHHMNTILRPLASLNENTYDEFHSELHSFKTAESRTSPYSNKGYTDDSLVKATIMWRPIEDNVKEKPDELRCFRTSGCQQHWKSFTATNLFKKATYGEKENMVSGPRWARGSLDFPNASTITAGLSGFVDAKRLQEGPDFFGKPVIRPKINSVDEVIKEIDGPRISSGDGKPVNRYKAYPPTAILGRMCAYSSNRQPGFGPEDSMCFASDSSLQTSVIESRKGAHATALVQENMKETFHGLCLDSTLSVKSPLLSQYLDGGDRKTSILTWKPEAADPSLFSQLESQLKSTQIFEENVHDVRRLCCKISKTPHGQSNAHMGESSIMSESLTIPVFPESSIQILEDAQTCETISTRTQIDDHFVVLFSEEKNLNGSAGKKIRQELLKLSSFCSQYSYKIQSWATCVATGKKIKGCLRCLRQIFSSPPKGFVNLKSHKIPEFSTKGKSHSSSKKLAKDKELKAVLTKINEVLVSMERTSLDSMQESNPKFKSQDGFKASCSCKQHNANPWQQ